MGLGDANSAEHGVASENMVVVPVSCPVPERATGAPALSGKMPIRVKPGTKLHKIYGRDEVHEEYFCNYEVNAEYRPKLEAAGMNIVAVGPNDEVRAVELPEKEFFIATLFQPQLTSRGGRPHPVVVAFVDAVRTAKGAKRIAAGKK